MNLIKGRTRQRPRCPFCHRRRWTWILTTDYLAGPLRPSEDYLIGLDCDHCHAVVVYPESRGHFGVSPPTTPAGRWTG